MTGQRGHRQQPIDPSDGMMGEESHVTQRNMRPPPAPTHMGRAQDWMIEMAPQAR